MWVGFDPELDLASARFKLTDMGNAERWRVRHGANFRFCAEIGWFAWDGRRWKLLSEEKDALPAEVMQSVFATVRAIGNEAVIVAATGCRVPIGLTERKMDPWLDWAGTKRDEALEALGERDETGELGRWAAAQESSDLAIDTAAGKRKLWSDTLAAHAKASEAAARLSSVAKLAKAFPDIAIRPDHPVLSRFGAVSSFFKQHTYATDVE